MESYFAKFLPVQGNIEYGDWMIYPINTTIPVQYLGGDLIGTEIKVCLHICTNIINVGDTVRSTYDNNKEFVVSEIKMGWRPFHPKEMLVFNKSDLLFTGSTVFRELAKTFKVMGKVSSGAIWVKEGDSFRKDELLQNGCGVNFSPSPYAFFKVKNKECQCFH